MDNNFTGDQFRAFAKECRIMLFSGVSHNTVKERLQPYIDEVNRRGKEIAKKYGKKPKLVSFGPLMR